MSVTKNEIAKIIVDAAIEVHRALGGPGWLDLVINLDERQVRQGIHRVVRVTRMSPIFLFVFLRLWCAFAPLR